jgi:hypothetical protein
MYVAIDFGISNTDLAISDKDKISFFSAPSDSANISLDTIKDLFIKNNIPISSVKTIGVTGGKSSDLDNSIEGIEIIKVNEIEGNRFGCKKIIWY